MTGFVHLRFFFFCIALGDHGWRREAKSSRYTYAFTCSQAHYTKYTLSTPTPLFFLSCASIFSLFSSVFISSTLLVIYYLQTASSMMCSLSFVCIAAKETACFFPPHQRKMSHLLQRSLISRGISTFLIILFDPDKLLNAVIYFCCFPVRSSVLLTRVFTPQTNILSDPNSS